MPKKSKPILFACLLLAGGIYYFVAHDKPLATAILSDQPHQSKTIQIQPKNQMPSDQPKNQMPSDQPKKPSQDLFAEFEALAKNNLQNALERAKHLRGDNRERAISAVFFVALETDAEFVAREVLASGLSDNQVKIVLNQLDMAWPIPTRGLEWIEQNLAGELRQASRSRLLKRLAASSPDEALEHLAKLSPGAEYDASYISVLLGWVQLDPVGAIDYAENEPGKPDFASILSMLSPAWIERDSASAKVFLENHTNDADAAGLAASLAVYLARKAPESTLKWTANLTGVAGEAAQRACIRELVKADPKNAASLIANAELAVRMELAPKMTAAWSAKDVVAAAGWVSEFPPNEQIPMVGPLLWNWINIDPEAAAEWTSGLITGPLKEKAVALFAEMESQLNGSRVEKTLECQKIISTSIQDQAFEIEGSTVHDCHSHAFPKK